MTYTKYEWTAFTEADLLGAGSGNGSSIGHGDQFTMPGAATVTMSTWDNDGSLSGDNWHNENANDGSGQYARVDGARVGSQMYAESYHVLHGSDGKTYYMIEIEVEGYSAPGTGDDYFTFYGAVPPAGVELTVGQQCNVTGCWVDYKCLSAGPDVPPNTPPHFTNLPENGIICVDENTTFVIDSNASDADGDALTYEIVGGRDAAFFEIDEDTGELTFVGAPDYENPQSGGGSNTYDVTIKVSDDNGGSDTKALWVKVKDVDESNPDCIVIEAEDMHQWGFHTVHGDQASGGELVKINCAGGTGDLSTTFNGESGEYDFTVRVQDEDDGQSTIMVKINGEVVGTLTLDQDNNGGGSNNGGFSNLTLENIQINNGDTVTLWAQANGCEFVRIDKIELCKDGEACPDGFSLQDFSGDIAGTTVADQFDGFTVTAQRDGDAADSENDAMIFDTANPTGGDTDLGFANQGNAIIISEDNDASDPDDNAGGGTITFDFDNPSDLHDIKLLDIEGTGTFIELFDENGDLIKRIDVTGTGDNTAQTVLLDATDVAQMVITLHTSGAVDDLCFKPGEAPLPGSLSGTYFADENKDGLDNDGANGIEGITVELLDENGNGTGVTTTTDGDGNYSFGNLAAGTYGVKFTDTLTGKTLTTQNVDGDASDDIDSDAADIGGGMSTITGITVVAGENTPDNDAGVVDPGTASVGDYVWFDANGNGVQDGDETGVEGVTVTLTGAGADGVIGTADDTTETTETAADGSYLFDGLDAGDYKVTFDGTTTGGLVFTTEGAAADDVAGNDSDADQTTGMTDVFTLDIGEAELDIDAGLVDPGTASLSGRYFCDENDDDVDNGEPGISGAVVTLLDGNGDPILVNGNPVTTTTDSNGNYSFTGLTAGTYGVLFAADAEGKTFVAQDDPDGNGDDTNDSDVDENGIITGIVLEIGDTSENNDAGVEDPGTASVGDYVWFDANGNGVQDGDEDGIEGVTVTLTGAGADGVIGTADDTTETTETAADGSYLFDGLDAGDYKVTFDTATDDGRVLTTEGAAASDVDGDDSDADQANGMTDVFTLDIGEAELDIDAGYVDPGNASVGDYVWFDANGNGIQDDDEVGVEGVGVTLTGAGADGVFGTADDLEFNTETAADGSYLFENLKAGDYKVTFDRTTTGTLVFTTASAAAADIGADDSDADETTGMTDVFTLDIGEAELDIDAGLIQGNRDPEPQDDAGMICADEELTVDVLANDNDADGDSLTITAVDGQAIVDGGAAIQTGAGTFVKLVGGQLVFDGEAAYADLDINESMLENISYTVSDGNGGSADANVAVTFKGDANSLDSFFGSFPTSGTYELEYAIDEGAPFADYAFDLRFLDTGDARLDGVLFEQAYCLDFASAARTTGEGGPANVGELFGSQSAAALAAFDENTVANANGLAGSENLDLINWVIAQDFEDQGYSGWEVQFAIWELADDFDASQTNYDVFQNTDLDGVMDIVNGALALAGASDAGVDSYVPVADGTVGLIVEPGTNDPDNVQPFIVAIDFESFDCIC